ncbi:LysE family translocator [Pelagerythrobacter marensis]|uniref:Membrane protein n=1 Tax=Pelagerythrobacter marensis TaxID=543877 RepID=A0A0G3XAD4_9SPHN|nr:LysE family translocator [Pelagerythrobacter marensis]AKM07544.1 membrane protein [Pelagerythrobacter marensis]
MSSELLLALAGFAFVASITPGPNNLMVMASGANFGFRRTIPHLAGILIGFVVMLLLVGIGLARIFEAFPAVRLALVVVSSAYLGWLAWKIATAAPAEEGDGVGQPFTFIQAALFQWVNPKAWMMALTATTLYGADGSTAALALVALVFGAINVPCVAAWAVAGQQAGRWLSNAARLRIFNRTMAILLLASLAPAIAGEFA